MVPGLPVSGVLPLARGPASPAMTSLLPSATAPEHRPRSVATGLSVHISRNPFKAMAVPSMGSGSREGRLLQRGSVLPRNFPLILASDSPLRASGDYPIKWEIWERALLLWLCVKIQSISKHAEGNHMYMTTEKYRLFFFFYYHHI